MSAGVPLDGNTQINMDSDQDSTDLESYQMVSPKNIKKKRKFDQTRNEATEVLIITRVDKKTIPFNFYNNSKTNWKILSYLDSSSLVRNKKGTVIKAIILPENLTKFTSDNEKCILNSIEYEAHMPKRFTPYIGELTLNMTDLEDRSILSYTDQQLSSSLQSSSSNDILSVSRIYPRDRVPVEEATNYQFMKISIEFQNKIPDRVFFESLSMPISPYIRPPTRCFTCQRYGHSSISCRRKTKCNNCGDDHFHKECEASEEQLKCLYCKQNHRASSVRCSFYKRALKIASLLQFNKITHDNASKMFAKMYDPNNQQEEPIHLDNSSQNQSTSQPDNPDFPSLPKSQTIKTKYRAQNYSIDKLNRKTVSATSERNILHSQLFSQELNEFPSSIPPGQISKSGKNQTKTPRHQSDEYVGILDGSLWQKNPLNSKIISDSEDCLDLGSAGVKRKENYKKKNTNPDTSTTENIWEIVKKIITKAYEWLKDKIETLIGSNSLKNIFSSGLSSLFSSLD